MRSISADFSANPVRRIFSIRRSVMRLHRRFSKTLLVAIAIPLLFLSVSFAQSRAARTAIRAGAAGPKSGNQPDAKQARETQPSAGQSLPLRRLTLYSNGVAYFERRGTVTGRAEIDLSFKQSQVDDVLKSLVVLDLGRGRVGAVSYNSSAPPSARLNEIPFSIDASTNGEAAGGLAGVLEQLQGARVAVTAANRSATGAVLTIGERQLPTEKDKPPVKTHTLVITTDSGELQSFDLIDVRVIKLLDEGARHVITHFSSASASAPRRDAKSITVTSEGDGQREMVISYTIAAPIWKTTYRVVLDPEGKPFFQGWAVVDNVSEEDWQDVSLSLVSGTPVSFIQPIQKPLYRYRPVIPIPEDLSLNPQVHDAAEVYANSIVVSHGVPGGVPAGIIGGFPGGAPKPSPTPPPPQQFGQRRDFSVADNVTGFSKAETKISDAITSGESGVETAATGSEVGELFEYRVEQPVTVRREIGRAHV